MKILHLPSTFFPASTGGKEVFVLQLIKNSARFDHLVLIHEGGQDRSYLVDTIHVRVLPSPVTSAFRKSYFDLVFDEVPGFETLLEEFKPDLVHFHDVGDRASLTHLRICKKKNVKTLLTYHSPGQSCLQRALLRNGKVPCDGWINVKRCTSCRYQTNGVPGLVADAAAHIEVPFVDQAGKFLFANSTRLYYNSWHEFYSTVDRIQVHARWTKEVLLLNGIDERKISFVELGGHASLEYAPASSMATDSLKLVFVGRCTDVKGAHLLIDAVLDMPQANLDIYFFGPYWDDTEYGRTLTKKISGDKRFHPPALIAPDKVRDELIKMDVCVIPSLWPETGPFTVLDAFAARLPIIGTGFAGISERVRDNVDGLLFEWNNVNDLKNKISMLERNRLLVRTLKDNIPVNHTFAEMGRDFEKLYQEI